MCKSARRSACHGSLKARTKSQLDGPGEVPLVAPPRGAIAHFLVLAIMYSYLAHHGYVSAEPVRSSLVEGSPPFVLFSRGDLPERWRRVPASARLGVEVPDTAWGRTYHDWAIAEIARQNLESEPLGILLTSMADFRAPGDARSEAARCLRALLETGKPPTDHVVQVL